MSPISHCLIGWLVANTVQVGRRERMLITVSAVIPDMDGLVIIGDYFTRNTAGQLELWSTYHHVLAHNIGFAMLVTMGCGILAKKRKLITMLLVWISFHLHLLGDLVGSRGPEGYQWPIPYLLPFSGTWQWTWAGQWVLNAWPNMLITFIALLSSCYLAWKTGISPLEMISAKANKHFVAALHHRFGIPKSTRRERDGTKNSSV
ncbi:MAG: metal-dependent hydrolase [Candidatus Electrothrix sp. AR3]|nr:metal-dependent hydrolase [Candidatus Electrothrix sp. AR3]